MINIDVECIKMNGENYAKFNCRMWNKDHLFKLPLKTNNKTLLESRLQLVSERAYFVFQYPLYQQKNPLDENSYYKKAFPWLTEHKEIIRKNVMSDSDLKRRRENHRKDPRVRMREGARARAVKKGVDFELKTFKDVPKIPKYCPIYGIPLFTGRKKSTQNSPTLDRIDNNIGYTKDNVQIISMKANQIKNNASFEDIEKLYLYMKKQNFK